MHPPLVPAGGAPSGIVQFPNSTGSEAPHTPKLQARVRSPLSSVQPGRAIQVQEEPCAIVAPGVQPPLVPAGAEESSVHEEGLSTGASVVKLPRLQVRNRYPLINVYPGVWM
jgi:hypothetical protein